MGEFDTWLVTVTDADIDTARRALADALERAMPRERVVELVLDWHRLISTQDQQRSDAGGSEN
jgi:hypothetical protein